MESPMDAAHKFARDAIRRGFQFEALHTYHHNNGEPCYWRIRLKHPVTGEKWIRPMSMNCAGYVLREPKFPEGKLL